MPYRGAVNAYFGSSVSVLRRRHSHGLPITETGAIPNGFALTFNGHDATDTRSEWERASTGCWRSIPMWCWRCAGGSLVFRNCLSQSHC